MEKKSCYAYNQNQRSCFVKENSHVEALTDSVFKESIAKGIVLVDFHAVWCGPCRVLSPIIEKIAEHFAKKIKVAKVDIDSEQTTAMEYRVTSVPTLILFKDGKEINRLIGLRDFDGIKKFVETAL